MKVRPSGVYALLDTQIIRGRDPGALAVAAARGGASTLQLRAKTASTREFVALAQAVRDALVNTRVPLIINDRVDVALAVGADGVHLGRDDMEPALARNLLGPAALIGVTIKNTADVDRLAAFGADVVDHGCIGGVFATRHKDNPDAPLGLDGFAHVLCYARAHLGNIPIGAIAGISADNAGALTSTGCDFVAVVGAIFDADDVTSATRALLTATRQSGRPT